MPCLRSNPKQKAEYLAYIDSQKGNNSVRASDRRLSGSSATSNTSTNSSAATNTAGIDNATSTTATNSATTATNITTQPRIPPQSSTARRRSERSPRQHQLPTPDPSPTLSLRRTPSSSPEPQTPDSPNPNRELTPAERAERRHRANLERQHLRMGIYGWCGARLHGALHSGRRHDYAGQGRTAAITTRERDEDRAALAAVGVFVQGL